MKKIIILVILCLSIISCTKNNTVHIIFDSNSPQVLFAVKDLTKALTEKGIEINSNSSTVIRFNLEQNSFEEQAFQIKKASKNLININASDQIGLMYGGLELTEYIRIGEDLNSLTEISEKPYIKKRGLKYNIPLDARTNTFDDSGDAAQNNIINMWDFSFWEEFFDNMARHRYNMISYWNAHPFSSMVKLDDYPDVAFEDVCGTTIKPEDPGRNWTVPELASIKIVENLKVLKKMTIEEKIAFWQKVMKHAKNRGIDVYFMTWNICLNGAAAPGSNEEVGDKKGKYGISNDFRNEVGKDYLRKSVKQFIKNYPDLTGIGVTAGENMRIPMTDDDKEKWLWETYGLGIMDAKAELPNREVKFIHRFWWTDMTKVSKYWGDYPDQFDMSFKYAKARLYSSPNQPFYKPFLEWMGDSKIKSWWNLRNDDIYIHRWGNPTYVSDFIKNMPYEQTAGFHMGSDGYAWGREFISKNPTTPRQLEMNKHWYKFMLWGRLGYSPTISNNRFEKIIAAKFPNTNAKLLFETWATASKIIPQVNEFHWRDWDYMWQPEACMEIWNDLRSVDAFRTNATMEESGILNPRDYVKAITNKETITLKTPLDIVNNLKNYAETSITNADELLQLKPMEELKQTLLDIKSMGFLGNYYANKISAAIELEYFKVTGESGYKEKAINYIQQSISEWEKYRAINVDRYTKQNFARMGTFDWNNQLKHVKNEIEVVKNAKTYKEDPYLENTDPWK